IATTLRPLTFPYTTLFRSRDPGDQQYRQREPRHAKESDRRADRQPASDLSAAVAEMNRADIGIDISRIAVAARTGTEHYTYELLAALARRDRRTRYTLYCNQPPAALPPL